MAYSTSAAVRTETPFKDSSLITDAYINSKIAEADSLIDSYVGQVYVLPLSETPPVIRLLSKDLTRYFLFSEQSPNIEIAEGVDLEAFYKGLQQILEGIQKRERRLFGADGLELTLGASSLPVFYPTEASSDPNASNSTQPRFGMNQKF